MYDVVSGGKEAQPLDLDRRQDRFVDIPGGMLIGVGKIVGRDYLCNLGESRDRLSAACDQSRSQGKSRKNIDL